MTNLREVKVHELKEVILDREALISVRKLSRSLMLHSVLTIIAILFFGFMVGQIVLYLHKGIIQNDTTNSVQLVFALISDFVFLIIVCWLVSTIKTISNLYYGEPLRSKYGQILNKYVESIGEDDTYYIDVLFNDDNTFIKKVEIDRQTYEYVQENDEVLVLSFNNKKAYGILK